MNFVETIDNWVHIHRVLISVSDKSGLDTFIPAIVSMIPTVQFLATGGTYQSLLTILGPALARKYLKQVSDYTGQPETQGGLVKTLDYKIYLGLLTESYNDQHQQDLARVNADPIDMVVVNLYPFESVAIREQTSVEQARANIDIGGPCMLRAAAKNFLRVIPIVDPLDYPEILALLSIGHGALDLETRFRYARKAFEHTARYDAAIMRFLDAYPIAHLRNVYQYMDDPSKHQGGLPEVS